MAEIETTEDIMRVSELQPPVAGVVGFKRSESEQVPDEPGCYVLAGSSDQILYIGQSEASIRDRFYDHLADKADKGVVRFYYRRDGNPRVTEATWLAQYAYRSVGGKPPLHD